MIAGSGLWTGLVVVTLTVMGLGGCGPSNQFQPPPPPQVTVEVIELTEATSYLVFAGRTRAEDVVELRARVKGFLEEINFEAGSKVEKGQVLFRIDPKPFEAAVAAAEGRLANATAAMHLAMAKLQKNEQLFKQKVISEIDILEFRAEQDAAVAEVKIAQADLESAKLDLSYTTITAPVTGRMSRSLVDPGNLVGAGDMTLLSTLVNDNPIYGYFELDERAVLNYLQTKSGEGLETAPDAILEFSDGSRYPEMGKLDFVDNRIDPGTGTIQARAVFPNGDGRVVAGLFVRVLFPSVLDQAMVIPAIALLKDLGGNYVLTVGDDGTVGQAYVQLGPQIGNSHVVVDSGLEPGAKIIVLGQQRARPGGKVVPEVRASVSLPGAPLPTEEEERVTPNPAPRALPEASPGSSPPDAAPSPTETEEVPSVPNA